MGGFSSILRDNPMVYVPLSPLLNNSFNMLYGIGQQERQESAQKKAQRRALWGGMAQQAVGAATTLGAASIMAPAMSAGPGMEAAFARGSEVAGGGVSAGMPVLPQTY